MGVLELVVVGALLPSLLLVVTALLGFLALLDFLLGALAMALGGVGGTAAGIVG
jgi:hypothetical protein